MSHEQPTLSARDSRTLPFGDPVRVLIVGDVRLYREGLARALTNYPGLCVVDTAANRVEAEQRLRDVAVDVVLLDIAMRDGTGLTRAVVGAFPNVKIVALAVGDRDDDILACAEAGLAGYVPQDASLDDLARAIVAAANGELHCSPRVAATLFRRLAALSNGRAQESSITTLTAREIETVRLVARGLSNKEIAAHLGIETATVKNHVHKILEKLHLRRRSEISARLHSAPGIADARPARPGVHPTV